MNQKRNTWKYSTFVSTLMLLLFTMSSCEPQTKTTPPDVPQIVAPVGIPKEAIWAARDKFTVELLEFDASQEYGTEFPFSDFLRLRVTNNANITIPVLTIKVDRYSQGKRVGGSRTWVPTDRIKPGESKVVEVYPKGHLPNVGDITIEIEQQVSPQDEQFIRELQQ